MIQFLQTEGPFKKIVLSGLLLLICAAMVIAFVPGIGSNDSLSKPGVVAKVDGEDITSEEVRETARGMLQQQGAQLGANAALLLPFFAQRAADQLVDRQALVAEAQHLGFKATPEEVKDELQHGQYAQVFFPGGTFIGQAEYQELLQQHNLTPVMFEEDVRKGILISKLQALITGGAFVSDAAVRQQFDKENTKIKFEYAVFKQ